MDGWVYRTKHLTHDLNMDVLESRATHNHYPSIQMQRTQHQEQHWDKSVSIIEMCLIVAYIGFYGLPLAVLDNTRDK